MLCVCVYGKWSCWEPGGKRKRGKRHQNRVVCEFILSSITPILDEYLLSTSSKCRGCRWPGEDSTYQSLSDHLLTCLPIYSSVHLMTIHPFHPAILMLLLHLADNQSINTSICAPIPNSSTHPFISPSFLHLSIIYSSVHPHTPASISLRRLHQVCTWVV